MDTKSLIGKPVVPITGGLPMTVGAIKNVDGIEYAICAWFDGNRNVTDKFPVASLKEFRPGPRRALRPSF